LDPEANVTIPFNIEIIERDRTLILVVEGELDLATAGFLDEELARAKATDASRIVIDLARVEFIDSSGLHVLIKHACSDNGCGRVWLTKGSRQAQRLFEITGALEHLPFVSPD
jgi:anti-anti-sigma factor